MNKKIVVAVSISVLLAQAAEVKRKAEGAHGFPKKIELLHSKAEDIESDKTPAFGKNFVEEHARDPIAFETFGEMLTENTKNNMPTIIAQVRTFSDVTDAVIYKYYGWVTANEWVFGKNFSFKEFSRHFTRDFHDNPRGFMGEVMWQPLAHTQDELRNQIIGSIRYYAAFGNPDEVKEFFFICTDETLTEVWRNDPGFIQAGRWRNMIVDLEVLASLGERVLTKIEIAIRALYIVADFLVEQKEYAQALKMYKVLYDVLQKNPGALISDMYSEGIVVMQKFTADDIALKIATIESLVEKEKKSAPTPAPSAPVKPVTPGVRLPAAPTAPVQLRPTQPRVAPQQQAQQPVAPPVRPTLRPTQPAAQQPVPAQQTELQRAMARRQTEQKQTEQKQAEQKTAAPTAEPTRITTLPVWKAQDREAKRIWQEVEKLLLNYKNKSWDDWSQQDWDAMIQLQSEAKKTNALLGEFLPKYLDKYGTITNDPADPDNYRQKLIKTMGKVAPLFFGQAALSQADKNFIQEVKRELTPILADYLIDGLSSKKR